ncbi:MAG: hypothetical protein ACTSVI_15175, partial [Promethearchaeota archaeon]
DMMGQSKNDFLNKGIAIKTKGGGGGGGLIGAAVKIAAKSSGVGGWGTGYESLPRAKMWIQFETPAELIHVAELLGIKAVNKRGKDYVFALEGTIYYARE